MNEVVREGFSPYVVGLDESLEGGIPKGSWVVLFGNPGAYKTLHSLAFTLAALDSGEKVVYVSTEMDWKMLKKQAEILGWSFKDIKDAHLTLKLLEKKEFGDYDLIWIDLDSLRYLAWKLNRLIREEKEGSKKRKYYWYYDADLVTYAIILGLEGVGLVERKESEITLKQVDRIRLRDGLYDSKKAEIKVNKDVVARVIIDSISVLYTARWAIAGRILTDMKIRLELPQITYLLTSHVARSNEEEMGAQVGHVVDGRIRLWNELKGREGIVSGWIAKMRLTDHSRHLHKVVITRQNNMKVIRWVEES
jgi:KaiC/GvpD/RAD55 family RecA-like ATPase